jgi:Sigma-70, region 4
VSRTKSAVPIERYTAMSQAEVGKRLGISAMRVCQIEKAAFAKIRMAQGTASVDRGCTCFVASGLCRHRVELWALPPEKEEEDEGDGRKQ